MKIKFLVSCLLLSAASDFLLGENDARSFEQSEDEDRMGKEFEELFDAMHDPNPDIPLTTRIKKLKRLQDVCDSIIKKLNEKRKTVEKKELSELDSAMNYLKLTDRIAYFASIQFKAQLNGNKDFKDLTPHQIMLLAFDGAKKLETSK
jgi:hypothetical protein